MAKTALIILGQNIRRLRTANKISQERFAEQVGVSRRFVQELEGGLKGPLVETLAKLRKALDASWDDLLKGL